MKSPSSQRVAVLLDFTHSYRRGIIDGLMTYARVQRRWIIELLPAREADILSTIASRGRSDGLIVAAGHADLAEAIRHTGTPAVNVSGRLEASPLPRVGANNWRVGELGAEHLLDLGLRSFAFYCDTTNHFCFLRRQSGFIARINAAGYGCEVFHDGFWHQGQRQHHSRARTLHGWLRSLPPHTGLMTATDNSARTVINACRTLGIAVPDDLAVVGVDLDPLQSSAAGMLLTSVDVNPTLIGFEAARLLDRIFQHEKVSQNTEIAIEPRGVVRGVSTDFTICGDEFVAKALSYMRDHARRGILVDEIASHVHLSRRSLERRFADVLGRSPHTEVRRLRIEQTKDLLAQTKMSIGEIAQEMGFGDVKHLSTAFREETGCTPTHYRQTLLPRNQA